MVVDVAMDLMRGQEDVGNVRRVFRELKKIGHRTGAVICVLHHVRRGEASNGDNMPELSDGLYGGEQVVEAVIGLSRGFNSKLAMKVLANRQGPAGDMEYVNVDYARARVWA